jgi:predicted transcriptional regulator
MNVKSTSDELLEFFKALADANRLKIVGLLSQKEFTVEQLAALLELRPSTVSHHLSRLARAGLVSARAEGYYSVYKFETDALEDMARRLLAHDELPAVAAEIDMDAFDRKVVADFSRPDGRLRTIPAQHKKLLAILRHIVADFRLGTRYTEKKVNEKLAHYHEDTATLRRKLVDTGLMQREAGKYWKTKG